MGSAEHDAEARAALVRLLDRSGDDPAGLRAIAAFEQAAEAPARGGVAELVGTLGVHAPALLALAVSDPSLPADVLSRDLWQTDDEGSMRARFLAATAGLEDGPELRRVLRRLRHRAMVRIALREVLRIADVDRTSAELAALGAAATEAALAACLRTLTARRGEARDPSGRVVPLTVLGMGKLGGAELNLGSDVDLCFFYGTDDATVGDGDLTVHELYSKAAARTASALGDVTEDGFCFRVDLRLRPEGSRGPLVNSLASAERYYTTWGRTWERAAFLRARPIAGDLAFGEELLATLRPFVYRRRVDPQLAEEMADMLRRSRRELAVDEARDLKLGTGGIREAEFVVQTLQLIWGGQHPELRVQGTVDALRRLRALGLLTGAEAEALESDWALLRRIEHRIHMRKGYQTHSLPTDGAEADAVAASLGFEGGAAMTAGVDAARGRVAALFRSLAPDAQAPAADPELSALCDAVAAGATAEALAARLETRLRVDDPDEAAAHLARLGRRADSPLGPFTRERCPELGELLLREVEQSAWPDAALRNLAEFFARLGGPWGYERLFLEEPRLARRLIGLFGASATLSAALVGHPEAADLLLAVRGAPTPASIDAAHTRIRAAASGRGLEEFVSSLRREKREVTLQVGLAHVADEIDLGGVQERLTHLARAQVDTAFDRAMADVAARWGTPRDSAGEPCGLSIVGLGKLGGGELGFGSDLDLLFVYGEDGDSTEGVANIEVFTRAAQRTLSLLSQPDAEGPGYETDTRLRPSGSQGTLVVSLGGFERYHAERGSAWERQALIRARAVTGDPRLGRELERRCAELAFDREPAPAPEVARLRGRMEAELGREKPGRYHPKFGYGGLVDVELAVQWLQTVHGRDPALRSPRALEALGALREAGLVEPDDADALARGHDFFRSVEQALKLLDERHEAVLVAGGPVAERLVRRLGIRQRDGLPPRDVLVRTWEHQARAVRRAFERLVAPVGRQPAWAR